MNLNTLEKFAVQTRTELKDQVQARLTYVLEGDSAELRGRASQIEELRKRVRRSSAEEVIEEVAYTWFNRLAALKMLDARDFHPFRMRVLMPAEGMTQPELFQNARQGIIPDELKGLNRNRFNDLLDGRLPHSNPQTEAYRMLLVAVCNAYHEIMPFLFEPIADHTELLLPEDLLSDASIAAGFRNQITNEDCQNIEIIGWLYQFYISEKKDEGDRQGGGFRRHSGGDPALHTQLDCQVHDPKLAGSAVAGDLSRVSAQRADGILHRACRADR